jgi:hypothetical protein
VEIVTFAVCTASERPDLWQRGVPSELVWPEYNLHGDVINRWWDRLDLDFADFQFVLYDEMNDEVIAEGHTAPMWWSGEHSMLPDGIDSALNLIFGQAEAGTAANTLCVLAAERPRATRARGVATQLLNGMRAIAQRHQLTHFIAPVRPSMKHMYPLAPIERYVQWRRDDGQSFDPWMRVHERVGAQISTPLPHSLRITGTVEEWEEWTGMTFPESGRYVFPEGLTPLSIDRSEGRGRYWEPNVWMVHPFLRA